MNTPGAIAAEKTAKNIHYDLRRYGFIMSPISYGMSSCKKSEIIKGISFSSMKLEYDKNGNIYIRFAINRLKSNMTIQKKSYSTEKTHTEMDIQDMDNTTPFNVIKWSVNYQSSVYDAWFSEKAGLITDDNRWIGGMSESMGWYALHRFNKEQYTCNFIRSSNSLGEDGYGGNLGFLKAVRDRERNTLPIKNGYYVLDLRDWPDYRPLYLPYSKGFIKSHWGRGMIIFEYR